MRLGFTGPGSTGDFLPVVHDSICVPRQAVRYRVVIGTAGSGARPDALRLHHHREAWQN